MALSKFSHLAAELTDEERAEFESCYRDLVDDWRPVLRGPVPATNPLTGPDFGASVIRA